MGACLTAELPLRLVNLANESEHWATRARRAKVQREAGALMFAGRPRPVLPLLITITRIGPRRMDSDGLAISGKHVRDGVADWLRIDDGHPAIEWRYEQERGKPKQYAVRGELSEAMPKAAACSATR